MTGDGTLDLVVETQGQGFGGFGGPQATRVGRRALALNLGDLDGNGTLDAVLSIQGAASALGMDVDHVQIFRNPVAGPVAQYLSPPGEFSTFTPNPDTSYTQTLKFDTTGKQTAVTDRNGNTRAYAYDAQGRLETITDPVGLTTTVAYSGALLSSITDPVGRQTQFQQALFLTDKSYSGGVWFKGIRETLMGILRSAWTNLLYAPLPQNFLKKKWSKYLCWARNPS